MRLVITKDNFEVAVPAAREPKGKIFDAMQSSIDTSLDKIETMVLGGPGVDVIDNGTGSFAEKLRRAVIQITCVSAFLDNMRSLDLVLTATGFGVVSTQDTAPASKMRVDALEGELRRKERMLHSNLLRLLFKADGWSDTRQRFDNVETLFWSFGFLEQYAGKSNPKPDDWDANVPVMQTSDYFLRKHIGNAYMDELLSQLTSDSLTKHNLAVVVLCQKFIGASISGNTHLPSELYMRLINTIEADLDCYPLYRDSVAYQLNHFKPYENKAEDTAFHFVG